MQAKSPLYFISCLITSLHHTFHPSKLRTTFSFPKFLLNHSINFSLLFFSSFSSFYCCACVLVCVRRRSRCERGRTHRGICRAVPRAGARRPVLRAGAPGRIQKRQVQSHPLMHISTQFYKHNLLACFTKLHMLLLLKHGWIATLDLL